MCSYPVSSSSWVFISARCSRRGQRREDGAAAYFSQEDELRGVVEEAGVAPIEKEFVFIPYPFGWIVSGPAALNGFFYAVDIKRNVVRNSFPISRSDNLAKQQPIKQEGTVTKALPNSQFRVKLENGYTILGFTSGKMRRFSIRILPGDRVDVEMSPYDLTKGRIVYRYK